MAKMPRPVVTPSVSPSLMSGLLLELDEFDPDRAAREYPWAERFVMGLPLAPWQRPLKWSTAQCERFITSAWTGVYLGNYLVTSAELRSEDGVFRGIEYLPLSNCVIDGQQRLKALELYVTDQLAVSDADGRLALWSDVDVVDKRRFRNTVFSRGEIKERDEYELRRLYDLLNFGGVAHEEHERALPARRAVRP